MIILKVKNYGDIKIELNREYAPISSANFTELARSGFYTNLGFHRVIKNFVLQGGDPKFDCTGGPGYSIKGEFISNGVKNPLKHKRGALSMARSMNPNSAGSQFFICHKDCPSLDGDYAVFGEVVEGLDIVDAIANLRCDFRDKPLEKIIFEDVLVIDEPVVEFEKLSER
ncbi:MAG: peptidylprolyl isomerase [Gammaproteobacteria bacterium]|nr:peptidylprolyl isomerase [Gammaproteobacteria bacterium]